MEQPKQASDHGEIYTKIDNTEYAFYMLNTETSVKTFQALLSLVSSPLGVSVNTAMKVAFTEGTVADAFKGDVDIGQVITLLCDGLAKPEAFPIIQTFLSVTHIKTKEGNYRVVDMNTDFHGKLFHLMKVVSKSLEVNYQDFLDAKGVVAWIQNLLVKFQT